MTNLASFFGNVTFTWDLGIIAFLFFGAFFYGMSIGRRRLALFLSSLYFGFVLIKSLPYLENFTQTMGGFQKSAVEAGLFVSIVFIVSFFLAGSIFRTALRLSRKEQSPWWHLLLLSFATVGFLTSSIFDFFPSSYYSNLSMIAREIFISNNAHFWWAVGGIVVLVILRRKKKE